MFLVGLDIVGDKLMEINVFSPGGLGSAQQFEKVNFSDSRDRSHRTQSAVHAVLRPQLRQRRHVYSLTPVLGREHAGPTRATAFQGRWITHPMTKFIDVGSSIFKKRHPEIGARPGTLIISEDAVPPKVRMISYDLEEVDEREITDVEDLARAMDPENITWIDVQGFGDETVVRRIGEIFSIHPLALEDIVNMPQRPRQSRTMINFW